MLPPSYKLDALRLENTSAFDIGLAGVPKVPLQSLSSPWLLSYGSILDQGRSKSIPIVAVFEWNELVGATGHSGMSGSVPVDTCKHHQLPSLIRCMRPMPAWSAAAASRQFPAESKLQTMQSITQPYASPTQSIRELTRNISRSGTTSVRIRNATMAAVQPNAISKRRKFVADGVFYAELNEFFQRELAEEGYSGVEVRVTPTVTDISEDKVVIVTSVY